MNFLTYTKVQRILKGKFVTCIKIQKIRIYAPTPYSAVFLLHAPAPAPIKIGFGAVRCGLMWCGVGAVLRFGLDSFGSDWASSNVNLNLKNPHLQQL
jgi:hypothetical protein